MDKKAKWNYIFGAITITVIVGGTIYAIKKSKEAEKQEEEAITLEQAREMVADRENATKQDEVTYEMEIEEVDIDDEEEYDLHPIEVTLKKDTGVNNEEPERVHVRTEDDLLEDVEIDDIDYEEIEGPSIPTVEPLNNFIYYEEGIDPKEDKELRYDQNSNEAKHQFIRMELADWEPNHDVYRIMLQLFEFPFIPTNDGDEMLRTRIIDHKVQFFGFGSKWVKEVSFADVIFYYARNAEFNCGEDVKYWVEYFVDFSEFHWDTTSQEFDRIIMRMNNHSYFNEERQTFGLFGLTRNSMDQAISIASGNVDRSVTYDIEFNEFLKSCV